MEEWKEYKLGEISDIQTGPFGSQLHQKDYVPLGTPCIMPTNIGNRLNIDTTNIAHVKGEDVTRLQRHCVKEGDIIYSRRGDIEKCAYILPVNEGWLCGTGCLRIRVKDNDVNSRFLAYQLSTCECKKWIVGNAVGSTMLNLNTSILKELPLRLPSKNEQDRLVNILKSLDDKIEVNRRINDNLEQQAQALFKSWFVDFEPFRDQPFVESELGMIPRTWSIQTANDVFEINIGKTPPRKEQEWFSDSNEDNVWVSIADMGSCGMFISDSSEYLTDEAIDRFNIIMVERNTVLLSFKLTVGRVAIADNRLTTNEAIARFILPADYYREFLYLYLKQYKYENLGSTSSIATAVNSKTIKGMKLLMPPTSVISDFSKITKPLFEEIRYTLQESRRLAELRDTLLPRLMSGELKVNEIENAI